VALELVLFLVVVPVLADAVTVFARALAHIRPTETACSALASAAAQFLAAVAQTSGLEPISSLIRVVFAVTVHALFFLLLLLLVQLVQLLSVLLLHCLYLLLVLYLHVIMLPLLQLL
jgi:hypothetical protein